MLLMIYNRELDEEVVAAVKDAGAWGYTKALAARGEGTETEPKMGTHCWPGENNTLFLVVSDEKMPRFSEMVRTLKRQHPRAGIRGFILPVEESI